MFTIRVYRESLGITQQELAARLNVTQGLVSQWERGETLPGASKLPELAKLLGCTIDELFGRPAVS